MALIDCDGLCGMADPALLARASGLPTPSKLGIPTGMVQDLAARAALPPNLKDMASAAALAALPAVGGGGALARGTALFSKVRDRVQGASAAADALRQKAGGLQQDAAAALASKVSAPKAQALAAIEAARKAAEDAKAQAAAVEQAVRDGLAKGQTDVAAMIASVQGEAGKLTGIALKMSEAAKARAAALEAQIREQLAKAEAMLAELQARAAALPAVPPVTPPTMPVMPSALAGLAAGGATNPAAMLQDRWASLQSGMPAGLPTLPAGGAGEMPAWPGWGNVEPPDVTAWRASMAAAAAERWASLRAGLGPAVPTALPMFNFNTADPWGEMWTMATSGAGWPMLPPLPQLPSLPAPPEISIPPLPTDAAAMAALAAAAAMFRDRFGRSLAAPGSMGDLAELMESLDDCLSDQSPIDPDTLSRLSEWGGLASAVAAVRNRMSIDLSVPDMGDAFRRAVSSQQEALANGVAAWQEQRAQAVSGWLSLGQAATALDMPVSGAGALGNLGLTINGLTSFSLPSIGDMAQLGSLLSALDSLRNISSTFGINALSDGAASRLQGMADQVRSNLDGQMGGFATMASSAQGMTHAALDRFAQIDRSQAADLGLQSLSAEASPLMSQAPAALGVLNAAQAIRQQPMTRPGLGYPRRSRSG
jgi:hypothetical protein